MQLIYKKGYKYQLQREWFTDTLITLNKPIDTEYIRMDTSGMLTIKRGYAFDGASGPTIDSKNSMKGSLAHDALYQLIRGNYLLSEHRKIADELLRDICIKEGMWKPRAWTWYYAVRATAKKSSTHETRKLRVIP